MTRLRRSAGSDPGLLTLLDQSGQNVRRVSCLLRDVLVDYPERAGRVDDVQDCEHLGDRIARDIIHRVSANGGSRLPFSAVDGHALAIALDDIVEQTADALGVYGVEAPMEQAVALAEVLVAAAAQVSRALAALEGRADELGSALTEIYRLESEGDRRLREALASLFANGIDPMLVIRWKDIFESLESAVDACQTVAHVIEGITPQARSQLAASTSAVAAGQAPR
jgi:uncharacterized protein Yka (UPF0111/DUF47 family)